MKVLLSGYGQMGKEIEKILLSRGHIVSAVVDPMVETAHKEISAAVLADADVVIDFSSPAAVLKNCTAYAQGSTPVVLGTTGWGDKYDEIKAMQKEVGQRINEIDRLAASAKFSDSFLFVKDCDLQKNGAKLQVGQNSGNDNVIEANKSIFDEVLFSKLTGVSGNFVLNDIANGSYTSFDNALDKLDAAITGLTDRKALIGSAQCRLDSALNTLTTQYSNVSSAKSIITDTDVASEASNFTQNQILQQVSSSLLAQANQTPSIALSLI